jgi:hypothetical protein
MGMSARFWQALAVVAIVVATAGWTTVIVMNLNSDRVAQPTAAATDNSTDPPVVISHTFPELEALLPKTLGATSLSVDSSTGNDMFIDDVWSQSLASYLATVHKGPSDVQAAEAYDASGGIDIYAVVVHVDGITSIALRDAIIAAWKVQYPELVVSDITLGGKAVIKGVFGTDVANSYWYVSGTVVFDVETTDEAVAATYLSAMSGPGGPSSSPSATPTGSPAPTPSPS